MEQKPIPTNQLSLVLFREIFYRACALEREQKMSRPKKNKTKNEEPMAGKTRKNGLPGFYSAVVVVGAR